MFADGREGMQQSRVLGAVDGAKRFGEDVSLVVFGVVPIDLRLQTLGVTGMRRAGEEGAPGRRIRALRKIGRCEAGEAPPMIEHLRVRRREGSEDVNRSRLVTD
jgi:hypothetical protein